MADKHLYKVMFDIELTEDAAGYLDRQFPDIETECVLISSDDYNLGYLKAVVDGSAIKDGSERRDIQALHWIINDGKDVQLVPMEKQKIKISPEEMGGTNLS